MPWRSSSSALAFQLQRRLAGIAAEKFRIVDAVAPGVVPGILHRLGNHLHADDPSGSSCHGQGDGAHAAVQIQHRVRLGNACQGDGGLIQPLGLVVVDLVERPGGQPEIQAAQGILNIPRAVVGLVVIPQHGVAFFRVHRQNQCGKAGNLRQPLDQRLGAGNGLAVDHQTHQNLIPQHGVAFFRVHRQNQCGKAGNLRQPLDQRLGAGNGLAVDHQTHQNLAGHRPPADVDMAQQAGVALLVVDTDPILVDVIHHRILHRRT